MLENRLLTSQGTGLDRAFAEASSRYELETSERAIIWCRVDEVADQRQVELPEPSLSDARGLKTAI